MAASQLTDDLELAMQSAIPQIAQAQDLALNRQRNIHASNIINSCAWSVGCFAISTLPLTVTIATDNSFFLLPAAAFILGGLAGCGIAGYNMNRYRAINRQINGSP